MIRSNVEAAKELYNIEEWGSGYVDIDEKGHVVIYPTGQKKEKVDLVEIVKQVENRSLNTPFLVRFPQIIDTQISRLIGSFKKAIKENGYQGEHLGLFPYKVNHRKEFIDSLIKYGDKYAYGLEVGTKPELFAALTHDLHPNALIVCNGFKDASYIELAFIAKEIGKNVVLVIEGLDELGLILKFSERFKDLPEIGMRIKLCSRGTGIWSQTSGQRSKFGLTTTEIIRAWETLKLNKLTCKFTMLHYHIGSQIPDIRTIKSAVTEAVRVYIQLMQMGSSIKYLNVGGGIGVDYDGSKTSYYASANYNVQEFANDLVFLIGELCTAENVLHPTIVTESGRYVAAYHSVLVADIREIQGNENRITNDMKLMNFEHLALKELQYIYKNISLKNCEEYLYDAIHHRDDVYNLFRLGYLNLIERAFGEIFFDEICNKAYGLVVGSPISEEIYVVLKKNQEKKFLANFSIFNSIPDHWALEQLFPIVPISQHNRKPDYEATIVDITCDSDGCIDAFIDSRDKKKYIELHDFGNKSYYLAIFLTGAYQETLSMNHNLLGKINEVHVLVDDGEVKISQSLLGATVESTLFDMNYACRDLLESINQQITRNGLILEERRTEILDYIKKYLKEYPYLGSFNVASQ